MSDRSALATALTTILADTYALGIKTHGAHWNVLGNGFFQLHDAFGLQYEALFTAADELAERLRAIGSVAPKGIAELAKLSTIPAPGESCQGSALASNLADDHKALSASCARGIALAEEASDVSTADMLTARQQEHDKTAWMLNSYAQ